MACFVMETGTGYFAVHFPFMVSSRSANVNAGSFFTGGGG